MCPAAAALLHTALSMHCFLNCIAYAGRSCTAYTNAPAYLLHYLPAGNVKVSTLLPHCLLSANLCIDLAHALQQQQQQQEDHKPMSCESFRSMAAKNRLKVAHPSSTFTFTLLLSIGGQEGQGGKGDCGQQDGDCAAAVTK